jgi:phage gp37-like protein
MYPMNISRASLRITLDDLAGRVRALPEEADDGLDRIFAYAGQDSDKALAILMGYAPAIGLTYLEALEQGKGDEVIRVFDALDAGVYL